MPQLYPSEIIRNARSFGYKAANLMFLESCIEEFNASKTTSIRSTIPEFKAIPNNEIIRHLINNIPNFIEKWKEFCNLQGKSETLKPEAKSTLKSLREEIKRAFTVSKFTLTDLPEATTFMVRSTGEEDRIDVANPGGNESIASDVANISKSIGLVVASYLSEKSLMQRLKSGEDITDHFPLSACLIQTMVTGENHNALAVSGVIYTNSGHVSIQSAPGHGELIVNSKGNFDNYYITPQGKVYAEIRHKHFRLTPKMNESTGYIEQIEQDNNFTQATSPSLEERTATCLYELANFIENKYRMRMDIEFVYDGANRTINIVQARPIPEGYKRAIMPSALSNRFISEHNPRNIKANVITADLNSASVVTHPEEILICDNIAQALDIYLKGANQIKTVIVKREAPETSHEAGMFTSKAISVLQIENLAEARQWAENLTDTVLICDPQHKRLYQIPKSEYSEGLIQEGIYASTLTSHVTPIKRKSDKALLQPLLEAMKTRPILNYNGELLRQHLEKLSIPKFGTDIEQKNILISLLQLASRMLKKEQISLDLFKEIMLTGEELFLLLSSEEQYKEQTSKYYLNVFEKFNGLILSTHKEDVLSSSLVREIMETKQRKKNLQTAVQKDYISSFVDSIKGALRISKSNKKIFEAFNKAQREDFLELIALDKFIMKPENKIKWKNFCLSTFQKNQRTVLKYLVKEIIQHKIHTNFLNTIFLSEYAKDPHKALGNLYKIFDKGKEDRENFSKAKQILLQMEAQIDEWSKPEEFSQLHKNLENKLNDLKFLLKFDQPQKLSEILEDPINGPIAINYLNKLVDILDLSIKKVQVNNIYKEIEKEEQVENFRKLLKDFVSIMEHLIPSDTKNSERLLKALKDSQSYVSKVDKPKKEELLISKDFSISDLSLKSGRIPYFQSLADLHTLTHQIILQSLILLSEKTSNELIKNSPEEIGKINSIITSYRKPKTKNVTDKVLPPPSLSQAYYDYPELITKYHIPLRSHFASVEVKYNVNSNKFLLDFKLNGSPIYSADYGRWSGMESYAKDLIEEHTFCELISLESNSNFLSVIVEPDNFTDISNIMNIFKMLIARSFPEENLDISIYQNKLMKPERDLAKFDAVINNRLDSYNIEIRNKLKQWYIESLINVSDLKNSRISRLAEFAISGIDFMNTDNLRTDKKNTLKKLLTCDEKVFKFLISNKSIRLIEHGLNINSLIKRAETEDEHCFSKEDRKILSDLGLPIEQNSDKLTLLDELINVITKDNSILPKLDPLILKLTKRLIEDAILKDDENELEMIISKSILLDSLDKSFKFKVHSYLLNLAIHGHEQILTRFCNFEEFKDIFSSYFHEAVDKGKTLVVKTMLNIGMQDFVNHEEKTGIVQLHYDLNSDKLVPIKYPSSKSALFKAAASGNIEVIKLLLDAGTDINTSNSNRSKVLDTSRDKEIVKLLRKYAHNPVDYLLERHQNNPTAFMKTIANLANAGYDFNLNQSPDRFWDLDSEKITKFLNQEVANAKTTNFRKIIKSANREIFELALSFKPIITSTDIIMIERFYPDFQINNISAAAPAKLYSATTKPNSWVESISARTGPSIKAK